MVVDGVFKDLAWNRCERDGVVVFYGMVVSFLEAAADVCLQPVRREGLNSE